MLELLYSDRDIAAVIKPTGVSSSDTAEGMPELIRRELGLAAPAFTVHRLDNAVGGVMIYALTQKAAAALSRDIAERRGFEKYYLAVVHGAPEEKSGRMDDLLFHDRQKNMTYVVKRERKGVRDASLEYEVIAERDGLSLVRVHLLTGRTHQIRAQFASRKMPLVGDGRYGARDKCAIALWSYRLSLTNPSNGERLEFTRVPPENSPWDIFGEEIAALK